MEYLVEEGAFIGCVVAGVLLLDSPEGVAEGKWGVLTKVCQDCVGCGGVGGAGNIFVREEGIRPVHAR